jgi:hypothetical protein
MRSIWLLLLFVLPVGASEPVYTRNRAFLVQVPWSQADRANAREIRCYVRPTGSAWVCHEVGPANLGATAFRAAHDGQYDFLFVLIDHTGRAIPADVTTALPHGRVVVDTHAPTVQVLPLADAAGDWWLQCNVSDEHPDYQRLRVEWRRPGDPWQKLTPAPLAVPGVYRLPDARWAGTVRVTAVDRAANVTMREVELGGPAP